MQQEVTQFFLNAFPVFVGNGIGQFVGFFQGHLPERLYGLFPVPGTLFPQFIHDLNQPGEGSLIFFFHAIRVKEGIKAKPLLLLPVTIYYAGLMFWLSPYLGEMAMPVRIYGLIISFMLMLALHIFYIRNKKAAPYMVAGALLFVLSDSILAINKFYMPFQLAGTLIMLTYGFAQYLIVEGAVKYILAGKK